LHGWRFPAWRTKLASYWQLKIEGNRRRDQRNIDRLRRAGWVVIRVWEHEVERDAACCVDRIEAAVRSGSVCHRIQRARDKSDLPTALLR